MADLPVLLNVGFGNLVMAARVVAIVGASSAPVKRLREEASKLGRLVDATHGRKTRAILVLDSGHVVLSAVQPETIAQRVDVHSVPSEPREDEDDEARVEVEREGAPVRDRAARGGRRPRAGRKPKGRTGERGTGRPAAPRDGRKGRGAARGIAETFPEEDEIEQDEDGI